MDFETELRKTLSEDELRDLVLAKIKSFHGLLTRSVALSLIAKEKGLFKEEPKLFGLSSLPKEEKGIICQGWISKIYPIATYASGKRSRVIDLTDSTATIPLILWNDDILLADRLRTRDHIKVSGAYTRGNELHLAYAGEIELLKKEEYSVFSSILSSTGSSRVHVKGFVIRMMHPQSLLLSDGSSELNCIAVFGQSRLENLQEGDEIVIEDGLVESGKVIIDKDSRLLSRRPKDLLMGTLEKLDVSGETLLVKVDGQEIILDRENALRFLSLEPLANDISLSTAVFLKRDSLINNKIRLRISQNNGKTIIKE